jgi:hypothetical protein
MSKPSYVQMQVPCNLTESTLIDAVNWIDETSGRVRWYYGVHVSTHDVLQSANLLRRLAAQVRDNPLAPYINLYVEPSFDAEEWCLSATQVMNPMNVVRVGSVAP